MEDAMLATWKRLIFISAGAGAGFALAVSLIVGGFLWYQSRPAPPKPWNTNAILATFNTGFDLSAGYVPKAGSVKKKHYDLSAGEDSEVHTNELSFTFILENSTDSDLRLSESSTNSILVRLKQEGALTSRWKPKLTLPVFVPAKERATVSLDLSCYGCMRDISGFLLFDETSHYEIKFNLPADWANK